MNSMEKEKGRIGEREIPDLIRTKEVGTAAIEQRWVSVITSENEELR